MLLQIRDLLLPLNDLMIRVFERSLCLLEIIVQVLHKTLLLSQLVGKRRVVLRSCHEVVSELLD